MMLIGAVGVELTARFRDYFHGYPKRQAVLDYFQYGLGQAVVYARTHERDYDEVWVANENFSRNPLCCSSAAGRRATSMSISSFDATRPVSTRWRRLASTGSATRLA